MVCGVGPNKDMLLKIAADAGLSDKVILAGYRSDIPDILLASDLFVFPSFHEGMPVSALEAMACGLPLLCSKIRGNVDIVKNGDNGYLFDPSDYQTLAEKIELLMGDMELRLNMGSINKVIVNRYSLTAVKQELICLYS